LNLIINNLYQKEMNYETVISKGIKGATVFLESKSRLSLFSRALEKLHFTLSFPPTKDVLDNSSLCLS